MRSISAGPKNEVVAALLHDAIEIRGVRYEELDKLFGRAVADIVRGCSDTEVTPKPPWKERKEQYIAHVRSAPASVRFVSMCDKLHNARSILADLRQHGGAVWSRFTGGREGSLWYYRELVTAYRAAGNTETRAFLLDELDRTVTQLEKASPPT